MEWHFLSSEEIIQQSYLKIHQQKGSWRCRV